jgi:MGT family glycosyltransferase
MARIVFLSRNNEGHLFQALTLAQTLQTRGHKVAMVSQPENATSIAKSFGIEFHALDAAGIGPTAITRLMPALGTILGRRADLVRMKMFQILAEALLTKGPAILNELQPDIVVVDQNVVAGSTLCDHLEIPFVSLATSVPWHAEANVVPHFAGWQFDDSDRMRRKNTFFNRAFEIYMSPVLGAINRYRRDWKLPKLRRTADTFSDRLQLSQLCPALDFPRNHLPKCFRYIGSLGSNRQTKTIDFPWDKLDGRPLIFASMGTVRSKRNLEIFQKISLACSDIDAQLIMSLGRLSEDTQKLASALLPLPNNQILVGFAPQVELLNRASLLITHAGVNTVLEAIAREVPMIALPRNVDHPAMATRIQYAGIGLRASITKFQPLELRTMIDQVLSESRSKERLRVVRQDLERCGGVDRAADLIEAQLPSQDQT